MTTSTDYLFTPIKMGALQLPNRIIMAPLTRMRSTSTGVPSDLNVEYYGQRASAGLVIAEATSIVGDSFGVPNMPGIFSSEQIAGWKKVTDAVHARGGRIVIQILHAGRASHSSLASGAGPVAPSALAAPGGTYSPEYQFVTYETPHALEVSELCGIVALFSQAAKNALEAGFDGVEIHGANGYLLDEFLQDVTNKRTDEYGGSFENRSRLLFEVIDAVSAVVGSDRVGVRLSPYSTYNGMSDSNADELFKFVVRKLNSKHVAYLHMTEARASEVGMNDTMLEDAANNAAKFRREFDGPFISAGGYTPESGSAAIANGDTSAVAFGRMFLANPDLPKRIKNAAPLNAHDRATFYGGSAQGYTDYPELVS